MIQAAGLLRGRAKTKKEASPDEDERLLENSFSADAAVSKDMSRLGLVFTHTEWSKIL
jgi:hypothetical protein